MNNCLDNVLLPLEYQDNQLAIPSLQNTANSNSIAYFFSNAHNRKEIKVQDFFFSLDPSKSIESQNTSPIFKFQNGSENGQVIGSKVRYKEIFLSIYFYYNIPENLTTHTIPSFYIHYAIVYSKDTFFGSQLPGDQNPVRYQDVFGDFTTTVVPNDYSTPYSYDRMDNTLKYKILHERKAYIGGFNPVAPNPSVQPVYPNRNSSPFQLFFNEFVNLWDQAEKVVAKINTTGDVEPTDLLFSPGEPAEFASTPNSALSSDNDITTGSLWLVIASSFKIIDNQLIQPSFSFLTRVLYSDEE